MVLKLLKLELTNFKGIKQLLLTPNGNNTTISGDNATGKTTVCDAYEWLLFGKNSKGAAKFGVKTIGTTNLKYSVYGEFDTGEAYPLTLRRTTVENYRDVDGVPTYHGDSTEYEINGVPCKETEYKQFINDVCPEEMFRTVTNPYFLLNDPKKLREKLFELCTIPTDAQLMTGKYSVLPSVLRNITVEQYRKKANRDKEALQKQIDSIPASIQTAESLRQPEQDVTALQSELSILETQKQQLDDQLTQLTNGTVLTVARSEVQQAKASLAQAELVLVNAKAQYASNDPNNETQRKLQALQSQKQSLHFQAQQLQYDIQTLTRTINVATEEKQRLTEQYKAVYTQTPQSLTCPTCAQPLPPDKAEQIKRDFETSRQRQLNDIARKGKQQADIITESQAQMTLKQSELETLHVQQQQLSNQTDALQNAMCALPAFEQTETYAQLMQDVQHHQRALTEASAKLSNATQISSEQQADIQFKRQDITQHIRQLNAKLGISDHNKAVDRKIAELEQQLADLYQQLDELSQAIALCEDFSRMRDELIEAQINSMFAITKFRLFDKNKTNDDGRQCCIPMLNGVSKQDINDSDLLNIGLDVTDVFAKHCGITAPVFIDNAERTTGLLPIAAQMIKMVVREQRCPLCNGETDRRNADGLWQCKHCKHQFTKTLNVEVDQDTRLQPVVSLDKEVA